MSEWTITGSEGAIPVTGTFAELKLGNLRRILTNQDVDQVTFTAPGTALDADALFIYGETVTIKKDGDPWFLGRVNRIRRSGSPAAELITYELVGPWWWLEKLTYQQVWQCYTEGVKEDTWKSRVILGQDEAGDPITTGAQITDVINYAIDNDAPIALGTIDADLPLPMDEQRELSCADVIRRLCKFQPDLVCWFNYSAATPVFNCRKISNLTALSLSIDGAPCGELEISPRYDLKLPGVVIRYEITGDINGSPYEQVRLDTAGTTDDIETLVATLELAGPRITWVEQRVKTEAYPATPLTDKAFWKRRIPWLAEVADADLVIHAASRDSALANILLEGDITDWMVSDHEVSWAEDTLTIDFSYILRDGVNKVKVVTGAIESVKVIATDILAGTQYFRQPGSYSTESGEPVPSGLAAKVFASWANLHWEGLYTHVADEVSAALLVGRVLNLTDGLDAWATMKALIQRVEQDVDSGTSVITFGPPSHLGPAELLEMFRALRSRRSAMAFKARTSGSSADAVGCVKVGGADAKPQPGGPGGGFAEKFASTSTGYDRTVNLDPTEITKEDAAVEIKAREVLCFEDASTLKTRQVLCSAGYGDATLFSEITVVTAFQYNASNHQLQIKTRTVKVLSPSAESGWTLITGGQAEECDS